MNKGISDTIYQITAFLKMMLYQKIYIYQDILLLNYFSRLIQVCSKEPKCHSFWFWCKQNFVINLWKDRHFSWCLLIKYYFQNIGLIGYKKFLSNFYKNFFIRSIFKSYIAK